jgi:uncharacterized protein YjiS (DUF1127 family)
VSDEMKSPRCQSLAAQAPTVPFRGRAGPAFGWLANMMSALRAWRERHQQRRILDALSDHMLNDIGVSRTDLGRDEWRSFPRD